MESVTTLNQVLQSISELPVDEQMYLMEVVNKRLSESRRLEILARAQEAKENYRQGNVYSGDVATLMAMTEDD